MTSMKPVYLTHYKRTAFARAHPKKTEVDALAHERADRLLAYLIDHVLEESNVAPEQIDDLSLGCALGVKDQWSFGGRYPLMQSRLGDQTPSRSIDQQCGSGLAAIRMAALNIASGAADIAFAGGYENVTRIPMGPALFKEGTLTVPSEVKQSYDMAIAMNMGLTAEELLTKSGLTRSDLDAFAVTSHQRADEAQKSGYLAGEILSVTGANGEMFDKDACIRAQSSVEALSELNPAFKEDGQITPGNSSPLTSGAALSMVMSEEAIAKTGAKPLARIVAYADRGTQPELMGQGVVPAVERSLSMTGLSVSDIDFWEINEAFSIVPLYAMQVLGLDHDKVNVNGGALAIGHPLGASGVRLAGTLGRTLKEREGRYGVAAACIGGGQGIAMVLEAV